MRSTVLLAFASMASMVLAAPSGWSPNAAQFYSAVSKEIQNARRDNSPASTCDMSRAVLPSTDEDLPGIPEDQQLIHVGVGRGTQNYTCESPSADEKPVAKGALATVYDASCLAADYPYLLTLLPNVALEFSSPPTFASHFGAADLSVLGHHYFSNDTRAEFDIRDAGVSSVMKDSAVDAPMAAMKGAFGQLDGAVPWLALKSISDSTGKVKTVYRTNTAGGNPPPSCEGQPKDITIQYAAEYWFYG